MIERVANSTMKLLGNLVIFVISSSKIIASDIIEDSVDGRVADNSAVGDGRGRHGLVGEVMPNKQV